MEQVLLWFSLVFVIRKCPLYCNGFCTQLVEVGLSSLRDYSFESIFWFWIRGVKSSHILLNIEYFFCKTLRPPLWGMLSLLNFKVSFSLSRPSRKSLISASESPIENIVNKPFSSSGWHLCFSLLLFTMAQFHSVAREGWLTATFSQSYRATTSSTLPCMYTEESNPLVPLRRLLAYQDHLGNPWSQLLNLLSEFFQSIFTQQTPSHHQTQCSRLPLDQPFATSTKSSSLILVREDLVGVVSSSSFRLSGKRGWQCPWPYGVIEGRRTPREAAVGRRRPQKGGWRTPWWTIWRVSSGSPLLEKWGTYWNSSLV